VWKPFQSRIASEEELPQLFGRNGQSVGIGIIGGKVSGNLEILDIDAPELVEAFMQDVELVAPGLLSRLPIVETPRGDGACHIYYRGATEVPGNAKLASSEPRLQFDKRTGEPVTDAKTGKQRFAPDTLIERAAKVATSLLQVRPRHVITPDANTGTFPARRLLRHRR